MTRKGKKLMRADAIFPDSTAIKAGEVPTHLGFIMDGNGRWAHQRSLPRAAGHEAGMRTAREIVEACGHLGLSIVTLYAFSTENWQRPRAEVRFLMHLFEKYANREISTLNDNNVRLQYLGRPAGLPRNVQKAMERSRRLTAANTGLIVNVALNYGGRAEIVDAARAIMRDVRDGHLNPDDLDESTFGRYLYTGGLPDPDLVIRTSGEWRLSNFLAWQSANAFLWVTPTLWPDMQPAHVEAAISAWRQSFQGPRTNSPGVSQTLTPGLCKPPLNSGGASDLECEV
jgi:undecaprenyl diphosphate synthase